MKVLCWMPSTRDLNLICKLTNPSNSSNGKDLTEVSKAWKGLQDKGKIKELNKGQGQKSSTYFVPFDFGLGEGGDSNPLPSTHENPHTVNHRLFFGLSNILNGSEDRRCSELDGLDTELYTLEGIPKEDSLGERVIPFYLKIIWSPRLNKKPEISTRANTVWQKYAGVVIRLFPAKEERQFQEELDWNSTGSGIDRRNRV